MDVSAGNDETANPLLRCKFQRALRDNSPAGASAVLHAQSNANLSHRSHRLTVWA